MAKSANNFYTLDDVVAKGYDPLAFRLLILQTHYSHEAQFSWSNLGAAQNRLNNWRATAELRWQANPAAKPLPKGFLKQHLASSALANNIDTPQALFMVDQVLNVVQNGLNPTDQADFKNFLADAEASLGLDITRGANLSPAEAELLQNRHQARLAKDWALSDQLRSQLNQQGIEVRDVDLGQLWNHKY